MPGESRNNDLLRPQSPQVYRRRRQVAGVVLLVALAIIVGLIWWIVSLFRPAPSDEPTAPPATTSEPAPSAPSASPSPSPSQDASESASPSASASSSEEEDEAQASNCPPGDLVISAATDQPVYAEGEDPVLELRVDNTGEESCEANLGTTQQVFTVYSGSDRIFSTEDCQVGSEDAMVEISPDQQERARFTWPRVRSAPQCEEIAAAPRSGTYRL
jgi:cytoskeletal protein RodZ